MKKATCVLAGMVLAVLCSATVFAGYLSDGWWYADDELTRYNPTTQVAQYFSQGTWVDDSMPGTNPAAIEYLSSHSSSSCSSYAQTQGFSQAIRNNATNPNKFITTHLTDEYYKKNPPVSGGSSSSGSSAGSSSSYYEASDLPEWDYSVFLRSGLEESDFRATSAGTKYESDIRTIRIGLSAVKDRLMLLGEYRYEYAEGERDYDGVDSRTTGVLLMPGYRVWSQEETLANVDLFAVIDLAYQNYSNAPNQWRFSPGVGVSLSRMTDIGLFQTSYTFSNSRNIDGDEEVTGSSYINVHGAAFNYVVPLFDKLFLGTGLSYASAEDVTGGLKDDFTDLHVSLMAQGFERWDLAVGYYQAIDGADSRGFDLRIGYRW